MSPTLSLFLAPRTPFPSAVMPNGHCFLKQCNTGLMSVLRSSFGVTLQLDILLVSFVVQVHPTLMAETHERFWSSSRHQTKAGPLLSYSVHFAL